MAHRNLNVADFGEAAKPFRHFLDRSRDQGFRRDAALAPVHRLP
jgi:hypothetical protein